MTIKHRMSHTRTFKKWAGMLTRCYNPNASSFYKYGARGISVCPRWRESFENFYADMGEAPPGLSLDRIDNNGNYEPSNCRWADDITQARNKRNTMMVVIADERRPLIEWCEIYGIDVSVVYARVFRLGWEPHIAVTTPKYSPDTRRGIKTNLSESGRQALREKARRQWVKGGSLRLAVTGKA